ncbi:MAG: FAD-dependent oxidoreductase [Pseudomonadota bacterium]
MAEVTIYGAGIFGLSIAFTCLKRGAKVRVIDPAGPGAGASGGIVGALAPHVPENWNSKKAFQFESLLKASGFWDKVEAVSGKSSGYERTGRLQPVLDEKAECLAKERAKNAADLWQGEAVWEVCKSDDFEFTPKTPTGLLIHDTLSARLHPAKACDALATAILRLGGEILTAGKGQGAILHATGVHDLQKISHAFGQNTGNGVKGQAALIDFSAQNSPQLFADTLHIIPHADGTTAVGSTSERDFSDANSTSRLLDDLLVRAREAVPALVDAPVIARWAGVRPRAKSRAPMLGHHPLHKGEFIANGGFKIGFGVAPMVAEVMADLILDGKDTIPEDFHPSASLPEV